MTPYFIFETLYASIAIGFFTATYIEGMRAGDTLGWRRLAVLSACSLWPILLLLVIFRFKATTFDRQMS